MTLKRGHWVGAVMALALAACGDTVKFPDFGSRGDAPSTPTTPTDPVTPTKTPEDTADPDEPLTPADPVDPVDPTVPTDPLDPTDPVEPGGAADPVDPTNPEDPADPVVPDDPTDPVDPILPIDPVEPDPVDPTFTYYPVGNLIPGSGQGTLSETIFAPDMVFPVLSDPAIPQSQVFNFGGGVAGGDQCDARNYQEIWRDNFCEQRSRFSSPYCPAGEGVHLGQDIRVGTAADCNTLRGRDARQRTLHKVVAVEDGEISNIGSYTVTLKAGGRIYRYLHLNMRALQVSPGDTVEAGDLIGYVSNDFGGTPTTFHLHFEIKVNDGENGWVFAPPYTSLLDAYARREGNPGEEIETLVGVASGEAAVVIPEGYVIVE